MKSAIPISILSQPDETTCGPTCLHTIYQFYGDEISLETIINEVPKLAEGGTLGAWLATHALRRGYKAEIYSYNLNLFDPSWFGHEAFFVKNKLLKQVEVKPDAKLQEATRAYVEFLDLGGKLNFETLSRSLIRGFLNRNIPILTGLSATYLYQSKREYGIHCEYDDLRGKPSGHFMVLHGYHKKSKTVSVADPLQANPLAQGAQYYEVDIDRVINAILLGIITYDGNMIIIQPGTEA
ncbi:MAG: C39 family peptidase [Balneolaceae bacterium]|nr:C39 family peptidase [Balneolaceae bacterium]